MLCCRDNTKIHTPRCGTVISRSFKLVLQASVSVNSSIAHLQASLVATIRKCLRFHASISYKEIVGMKNYFCQFYVSVLVRMYDLSLVATLLKVASSVRSPALTVIFVVPLKGTEKLKTLSPFCVLTSLSSTYNSTVGSLV